MTTFRHGGKIGDVIFSLPAIRELGGGALYLPESTPDNCPHLYSSLKDLLAVQPFIREVREYPSGLPYQVLAPGIHIDYDLDLARNQPAKGVIHIVKRYLDAFGINLPNWKQPWLAIDHVPAPITGDYSILSYTGRYLVNERMPSKSFDWKGLVSGITGVKVFVGTYEEYAYFCSHFCNSSLDFIPTTDVLELARVVRDASAVYCNQSAILALAQSMGKTYYLFPKPFKQNCILHNVPYENILR